MTIQTETKNPMLKLHQQMIRDLENSNASFFNFGEDFEFNAQKRTHWGIIERRYLKESPLATQQLILALESKYFTRPQATLLVALFKNETNYQIELNENIKPIMDFLELTQKQITLHTELLYVLINKKGLTQ